MFAKLTNICKWIVYLWKYDNPYDYNTIYTLLRFKLKQMSNEMEKASYIKDIDKDKEKIDQSIQLLDSLIENDFCKNELKLYYEKWGYPESLDSINNRSAEAMKEYKAILDEEERRERKIRLQLFMIIYNNIRKWWI